jgi:hypothetical protein
VPHEYCTLFDSNYLVKAVAMHRTLLRHAPDAHLTAFVFDDDAKRILDALDLPQLTVATLAQLEEFDAALLAVKGDRTPTEYCWTSTPVLPLYLFAQRPELDEVTYLDADLGFFADPQLLFDEMGDASVCITPHRYSPEYAYQEVNGIYCVQWLTFRRDERGMAALQWWHDRCIEWCYYRLEDGKLGDQKYLDDWPERFEGVHVLEHPGGGLAPWNVANHELEDRDGVTLVDLAKAIRALPAGQRAAFVLRKVEGRDYREIADVLACSEEAARARVSEATKKLKEAMK